MSGHLPHDEAVRLQRAEARWLEQARARLRRTAPNHRPAPAAPATEESR